MNSITQFGLEKHEGPYEQWPLHSRLLSDDKPTEISLPGYSLLHQFETPYGFVLVTDYDCPFEEITNFALVSSQMRLVSCRWLGWMYASYLLDRVEWVNDRTFIAVFCGNDRCRFTIRSWGVPYIRPRLKMQWLGPPTPEEGQADSGRTSAAPDRGRITVSGDIKLLQRPRQVSSVG